MATAATYTVMITALDKASAVFRKINMNALAMNTPFASFGKKLASLSEASGLTKVAQQAEHVGARFAELGAQVGELLGPLAGVAGIASAAGLVELSRGAAEFGHQLAIASARTGVSADQLARWHYAASTVGVDAKQMDKSLTFLNRTIADAASGKNHKALALFRAMHLSFKDSHGHLRSAANMFSPLANKIFLNPSIAQDTSALATMMGKSGTMLLPLMKLGGGKINELGDCLHRSLWPVGRREHAAPAESLRRLGAFVAHDAGLQIHRGRGVGAGDGQADRAANQVDHDIETDDSDQCCAVG